MPNKKKRKNQKPLERREYVFDITAADDDSGHFIEGRPIVYESVTDMGTFDEVIERGALNNTDLRDVRFLVNHNMSMIPLARSRRNNGNSTMQMMVDNDGMRIRVDLDTENNAEARALYSAVGRGDVSGMSFLFSVDDEEWSDLETEHPERRIKSISTVIEVSAVTFPAYDDTEIETRCKVALDNARSALDKARQHTTVDTVNELELLKLKSKILGGM